MNRRSRRPIVINLVKTQVGYAVDSLPRHSKQIVQFDLQSHLSDSSSLQDPFHINFNSVPRISSTSLHTTLPITSSWFHIEAIHDIEREALPEFFGPGKHENPEEEGGEKPKEVQLEKGKATIKLPKIRSKNARYKTQDDYFYCRNAIVTLWRENNKRYLTAAYCKRHINADHCSIIRVHGFLEEWGIINFPSKQYKGFLKKVDVAIECMVCSNKSLRLYFTDELGDGDIFQICQNCWSEKYFPEVLDVSRFRFVDLTQEHFYADEKPLTDEETNKLLNAIERHRHNWPTVAAEFPTRSIESLIVHYLKLPFRNISNFSIFQDGQDAHMPIQNFHAPTIFQDFNNPIQSGAATMYYKYKNEEGGKEKYEEILRMAEVHSQYLAEKQEVKVKDLLRFVIDFQMNKMEGKLVCLSEYKNNVEVEMKNIEGIRKNVAATLLHGVAMKDWV